MGENGRDEHKRGPEKLSVSPPDFFFPGRPYLEQGGQRGALQHPAQIQSQCSARQLVVPQSDRWHPVPGMSCGVPVF